MKMRLLVEQVETLFVATSEDLPGLLVAKHTFEECVHAIPRAIADLKFAREQLLGAPLQ